MCEYLFKYLAMLREKGPQEWIYNEIRDVYKLNFEFQEQVNPNITLNINNNQLKNVARGVRVRD